MIGPRLIPIIESGLLPRVRIPPSAHGRLRLHFVLVGGEAFDLAGEVESAEGPGAGREGDAGSGVAARRGELAHCTAAGVCVLKLVLELLLP